MEGAKVAVGVGTAVVNAANFAGADEAVSVPPPHAAKAAERPTKLANFKVRLFMCCLAPEKVGCAGPINDPVPLCT